MCLCKPGFCANVKGACEIGDGRRLGEFSIRFSAPAEPHRPYMGVDEQGRPATVATSQPLWSIAMTHDGYLRFESIALPGHVLTIYNNRRRRSGLLAQTTARGRSSLAHAEVAPKDKSRELNSSNLEGSPHARLIAEDGKHLTVAQDRTEEQAGSLATGLAMISDHYDLWPLMKKVHESSPLDANFLVHGSRATVGAGPADGLEIWDPQSGVALATVDSTEYSRNPWFGEATENGLAECSPAEQSWMGEGCEARKFVEFAPDLPTEAVSRTGRIRIHAISTWAAWQVVLFVLLVVLISICTCLVLFSGNDFSGILCCCLLGSIYDS